MSTSTPKYGGGGCDPAIHDDLWTPKRVRSSGRLSLSSARARKRVHARTPSPTPPPPPPPQQSAFPTTSSSSTTSSLTPNQSSSAVQPQLCVAATHPTLGTCSSTPGEATAADVPPTSVSFAIPTPGRAHDQSTAHLTSLQASTCENVAAQLVHDDDHHTGSMKSTMDLDQDHSGVGDDFRLFDSGHLHGDTADASDDQIDDFSDDCDSEVDDAEFAIMHQTQQCEATSLSEFSQGEQHGWIASQLQEQQQQGEEQGATGGNEGATQTQTQTQHDQSQSQHYAADFVIDISSPLAADLTQPSSQNSTNETDDCNAVDQSDTDVGLAPSAVPAHNNNDQVSPPNNAVLRCMVCQIDMEEMQVLEREVHVNRCLNGHHGGGVTVDVESIDADQQLALLLQLQFQNERNNNSSNSNSRDTNSTSILMSQARHEESKVAAVREPVVVVPRDEESRRAGLLNDAVYHCPICSLDLSTESGTDVEDVDVGGSDVGQKSLPPPDSKCVSKRIQHLKQCGIKHHVRPNELAPVGASQQSSQSSEGLVETGDVVAVSLHTNVTKAPTRSINDALLGTGAGVTSPEPQRTVFSALMQTAKGLKPPPRSSVVDANRGRGGARGRGRGRGRGGKGRGHWSRPAKRCFTSCPAFKIVAGTDLVVDGFLYAHPQLSMRYFLTHFHSDHYTGLDKHFSAGTIYMTPGTAALVQAELKVDPRFIRTIDFDTTLSLEQGRIRVTALHANHCPGAAMFLFQVGNRTHLHVGDFRFDMSMLRHPSMQRFVGQDRRERIDTLYLDTTYCDPKYDLPKQSAVLQELTNTVRSMPKRDTLFVCGTYSIGKEKVFLAVAQALDDVDAVAETGVADAAPSSVFNRAASAAGGLLARLGGKQRDNKGRTKIHVTKRKAGMLRAVMWDPDNIDRLSLTASDTNVRVLPMSSIRFDRLDDILRAEQGRYRRVVGVRPTGWALGGGGGRGGSSSSSSSSSGSVSGGGGVTLRKNKLGTVMIADVPYSEHSSVRELRECVRVLQAKYVVPTVNTSVDSVAEQLKILGL